MKVKIIIDKNIEETTIEVYTNALSEEVEGIKRYFEGIQKWFPVENDGQIKVLKPSDIYLIKSMDGKLTVETKDNTYYANHRLYEIPLLLGQSFMRISKNTYINLDYIDSVEATFSGLMKVKLTNQKIDYISRMYVKDLKKYLNIK